MSITLIVTRMFDEDFNETGEEIHEEEWDEFVEAQEFLRFRTAPFTVENPATGESVKMSAPEGATEVLSGDEWYPFLEYRNGELCMRYSQEFENTGNLQRKAVADVAAYFAALITHDAGDEILEW